MQRQYVVTALVGLAGLAASVQGQHIPVEVVAASSAHAPTSPKRLVSTFGTFPGLAATATFKGFANWMTRSPDGSKLLFVPTLDQASAGLNGQTDQLVLVRVAGTWRVDAQEGVSEVETGRFLGISIAPLIIQINNAGAWTLFSRTHLPGGTADTIGNNPDRIVKFDPAQPPASRFSVLAAAGGSAESAFGAGSGAAWGTTGTSSAWPLSGAAITTSGDVSFIARLMGSPAPSAAIVAGSGTLPVVISGTATPTNQTDDPDLPVLDIQQAFHGVSADGQHRIYRVFLDTSADRNQAVVVDNAVVVQEGVTLPGFTSPVGNSSASDTAPIFSSVTMDGDGTWFVIGRNVDGIDWVMRNGVVIAAEGRPIAPGSIELWEVFYDAKGHDGGRWVIAGRSDNASSLLDDVIVGSTGRILGREGDPVDLDSDGVADASFFMGAVSDRGSFVGPDLRYYFAARLKPSAAGSGGIGGSSDSSLLRVRVCWADYNDNGQVELLDIFDFLGAWFAGNPRSDFNRASGVDLLDIFTFLEAWFGGC